MKNIVIIGCNQGIGYELIRCFLSKDSDINVWAISRNINNLEPLIRQHKNLNVIQCDISDIDQLHKSLGILISDQNPIDILINNAGTLINKGFEEITSEDLLETFKVNYFAPLKIIQVLLPQLKLSENAHVVNIASIGGFQGSVKFPGLSIYSSSKSALVCLTECLAVEYAGTDISFNALCLGSVNTAMLRKAFPGYTARVQPSDMAEFIMNFSLGSHKVQNGKVLAVSISTP